MYKVILFHQICSGRQPFYMLTGFQNPIILRVSHFCGNHRKSLTFANGIHSPEGILIHETLLLQIEEDILTAERRHFTIFKGTVIIQIKMEVHIPPSDISGFIRLQRFPVEVIHLAEPVIFQPLYDPGFQVLGKVNLVKRRSTITTKFLPDQILTAQFCRQWIDTGDSQQVRYKSGWRISPDPVGMCMRSQPHGQFV